MICLLRLSGNFCFVRTAFIVSSLHHSSLIIHCFCHIAFTLVWNRGFRIARAVIAIVGAGLGWQDAACCCMRLNCSFLDVFQLWRSYFLIVTKYRDAYRFESIVFQRTATTLRYPIYHALSNHTTLF